MFCSDDESYRLYKQSVLFLMIKAIDRLYPDFRFEVHQSVTKSTYCSMTDGTRISPQILSCIAQEMRRLVALDVPLETVTVSLSEARDIYLRQGEPEKAQMLAYSRQSTCSFFYTGVRYHAVYGSLLPSAGSLTRFELIPFENGFLLRYPHHVSDTSVPPLTTSRKLFQTIADYRRWSRVLRVSDVFELNRIIREGQGVNLINISESLHEKMLAELADTITNNRELRLILISGPSSSGKTSFANRLRIHLRVNGIRPIVLSLDDYYKGRQNAPIDENGEYDYECLEAIDYPLFNDHLARIIDGETVNTPLFDFNAGERSSLTKPITLLEDQILIVEGIHALNETLSYSIPAEKKYKIYCTPLTVMSFNQYNPISPTDLRLMRRIIRDTKYRHSTAEATLKMWHSVRRGEKKNVFPFEYSADHIFNTALSYEFCVIKPQAEKELSKVSPNSPHYPAARQLLDYLSFFDALDESPIPPTSLIREFLGGSTIL